MKNLAIIALLISLSTCISCSKDGKSSTPIIPKPVNSEWNGISNSDGDAAIYLLDLRGLELYSQGILAIVTESGDTCTMDILLEGSYFDGQATTSNADCTDPTLEPEMNRIHMYEVEANNILRICNSDRCNYYN